MLINPPHTLVYPQLPQIGWPIGLANIGGVLQKNGYDVKIYDALASNFLHFNYLEDNLIHFGESWEQITKIISQYSPDIVGISDLFVTQSPNAHKIAQLAKLIDPNIKTVLGGPFAASMPKESIIDPNVDFIIMGEGEFRFLDLIKSLENSNSIFRIDGLVYKDVNGRIHLNEIKGYIENLDALPFPAIDLLNLENYFNATGKGKIKLFNISRKPLNLTSRKATKYKWMSVVTSRGCPHNCFFCAIPPFWGRKWRSRSPENVLNELRILINKYGIEEIQFEDDNLTFDKRRIQRILDGIISERLDIIWTTPNGVRADTLDRELLRKMKKSGCKELIIGVESGDQNVLNNVIGKNLNLQQVIKVAKICKELNIKLSAFYVTGLPGETEKSMKRTLDFATYMKNKYNVSIYMNYAIPLHGTRLFFECKEKDLFAFEPTPKNYLLADNFYNPRPLIKTTEFESKQLAKFISEFLDQIKLEGFNSIKKASISSFKRMGNATSKIFQKVNINLLLRLIKLKGKLYTFSPLNKRFRQVLFS